MAGLREVGLSKPVGGIGLALLQKMGYKEGSGLGAGGAGIAEPLAVEIRGTRDGLGVHEARFPPNYSFRSICRPHCSAGRIVPR